MAGDGALWLGCALAAAGVAGLRLSWGRRGKSPQLYMLGWAALAAGCIAAGMASGAWGVAVAALVATAMACLVLTHAAFEQPRTPRRAAEPESAAAASAPGTLSRGVITFALTGPVALAVAVVLALGMRTVALAWPVAEADANVMVLALVPLFWPLLAFAMLMAENRRPQIAMLAVPLIAASLPLLALGSRP
ncbi:hypothetical protein N6L26_09605 [Qipengyuania sp. SS22]|uniref:hypothetical protein n=1 Tax=Qipengyuania sp. SS22 TaxID=2979461 RepID=UPI0021E5C6C4|nr:hypothetical protein [Qipengyuania sp. SS22]UYH54307.1 hypothetical protein N6L26_09605 [Qipengyuania sp. SS22]